MHFLIVRYIMMKYWIWAWLCNWAHSFREFRNFAKNLEFLFFEWIVNIFRNWRIYTWHHKSWWRHNQWRHKPRKKLGENTAIIAERFFNYERVKGCFKKNCDLKIWRAPLVTQIFKTSSLYFISFRLSPNRTFSFVISIVGFWLAVVQF